MEVFGFDLNNIQFWHWLSLAGIFFVLEILTLGFFFLWLGASAVVVGLVLLAAPEMSWQIQFGLWAFLAVTDIFAWRVYMSKKKPKLVTTDEPHLNKRGEQYIGRVLTLEEPIVNGFGKVKVDDSLWKVECDTDMDVGSKVRVTAIDGTVLEVEVLKP
ncbi:MAG: NfeD family protein [Micavibrio sp.]|nr:NfeD family protein [Micavibrio sp.]